jgi:hypothetical protein
MIERQDISQSGEYRATWSSSNGQVSGTVYVKLGCPAHKSLYPYCVMLGPICYPPRDFQLIARIEASST